MKTDTADARQHLVSDGRVHCLRLRRDVSVETCWMCERLVGFDVDEHREVVRCSPGRMALEAGAAIL